MKKAVVSVISDLVSDQRVHRSCLTLLESGYDVLLVGRKKRDSLAMDKRPYKTFRFHLIFNKGPLFYLEFNIRLFFFLLFQRCDLLLSNDLDTLLPNTIVSRLKSFPLIYDSHEYFTGVPELADRPFVRNIWEKIEAHCVPFVNSFITVNDSIAGLYREKYNIEPIVVRNIPDARQYSMEYSKDELGLPSGRHIILLQGSGINVDRGAEEAVMAMKFVEHAALVIIGKGDVIDLLKEMVVKNHLEERVIFISALPFNRLFHYTVHATIGITFDKPTNINYKFSLPNKLFDYIQARIPVLSSRLVEIEKIITSYQIGDFIDSHEPSHIAEKMRGMIENEKRMGFWKINLEKAASELCWDLEKRRLIDVYRKYS